MLRPDELYTHELLTLAAAVLDEVAARVDEQRHFCDCDADISRKLAACCRKDAASVSEHVRFPPVEIVRAK